MKQQKRQFYQFDRYRIDPDERLLTRADEVVHLAPKAIDLLLVLLENHGRVVSKNELMSRVWPDTIVEEANLSHNIFQLRKVLGDSRLIETVPKRGYRFAGDVGTSPADGGGDVLVSEQSVTRISVEEEIDTGDTPATHQPESALPRVQTRHNAGATFPLSRFRAATAGLVLLAASAAIWFGFVNKESKSSAQKAPPHFLRLTNTDGKVASTISPDGKFVAYVQNQEQGDGVLYIRQLETNREIRLIGPAERVFGSTAFSRDGSYIYYIEHKKGMPGALFRIPALGGTPMKMLDGVDIMFGLSPDDRHVAFIRHDRDVGLNSLIVAALDGTGEKKILERRMDELHMDWSPGWSPDGRSIAFPAIENEPLTKPEDPRTKLFVIDVATGDFRALSADIWRGIGKIDWMADGSGVVFPGNLPKIGGHLYFVSYPEGVSQRLSNELTNFGNYGMGVTNDGSTLVADLWETNCRLSTADAVGKPDRAHQFTFGIDDGARGITSLPDGSTLYAASNGERTDIWRAQDGRLESLTNDEFTEFDLASPSDGSFLVFGSNRAGNSHIFRMEMSDLSVRQLTAGEGYETAPDVSPDGNWVVYEQDGMLWKIPSVGGEPVKITSYSAGVPAFSPDGKLISCIIPSSKFNENATLAVIPAEGGDPIKTYPVIPYGWYYRAHRWTPDGAGMVFRKTEKSVTNLWKQHLAGGEPVMITNFNSDFIANYAYSRDGKRLVVARGQPGGGVAVIKNFR